MQDTPEPEEPRSFDGNLSTISVRDLTGRCTKGLQLDHAQNESMVEIKHAKAPAASPDEDKHRLVYSKSKVYVNPTAYARDNIPGFVALVKRVSMTLTISAFAKSPFHASAGSCQPDVSACLDT
jgi:hypothetical protein